MRRRIHVSAVLGAAFALLISGLAASPATAAPPPTASVSGTVRNAAGEALAGVYVLVSEGTTLNARSSYTDAQGAFTVPNVSIGAHSVTIWPWRPTGAEYLTEWADGTRGATQQTPTEVTVTGATVNAVLERGARVTGSITGLGRPVDGSAALTPAVPPHPYATQWVTVRAGVLEASPVAPGDYEFRVSAPGFKTSRQDGTVVDESTPGPVLHVTADETIDVDVELSPSGIVTGKVLIAGAGGALRPCANGSLGVEYPGPPAQYTGDTVAADGTYMIGSGPTSVVISAVGCAGTEVVASYVGGALSRSGAQVIDVAPGEVVSADIVVPEAAHMTMTLGYRQSAGEAPRPLADWETRITVWKLNELTGYYEEPENFGDDERLATWSGNDRERRSPALVGGTYTIQVEAVDPGIGTEFYKDARYFAEATEVVVEPGETLDLGHMTLEPRYFDVGRIAGADRFATAAAIAQATISAGTRAPVVYIANGSTFPDALAASPAVITQGGAMLLTATDGLPDSTRNALVELDPKRVVVVGGPAAVSDAVVRAIKTATPRATVSRLAGEDRYETGRTIVRSAFESATTAFLATGRNFPDALATGAAAGNQGHPLVLLDGMSGSLDPQTAALLIELGVKNVIIVGGTGAVTHGVEQGLVELLGAGNVGRLAGEDRYETATLVNENSFQRAEYALLATGLNFPDALAAAGLAGALGAPTFLTPSTCVHSSAATSMMSLRVVGIVLVGGPGALSSDLEENLPVCE